MVDVNDESGGTMSDDTPAGWAAPGGGGWAAPAGGEPVPPSAPEGRPQPQAQPPQYPAPQQYPAPGQYPQPPQYQRAPFAGPPPGWAPPPKPGLVPLRPLTLGDILGASFRVFRRNPRTTFGTSLLFQAVVLLVTLGVGAGIGVTAYTTLSSALPQDRDAAVPGVLAGALGALLLPLVLTIAVSAILQGLFVLETSHQVVGEKMRLGGLLRQARGRLGALVGWVLLLIAAFAVLTAVIIGLIALLAITGGTAGVVFSVIVGLVGFFGVIALAVWILTKTALVPSILVLERLTLGRAIARSWRLTRRSFWRTFGIIALTIVIVQVASSVVSAPLSFLGQIGGGLLSPNGDLDTAALGPLIATSLAGQVVNLIFGAIGAVIEAAAIALVYIDLRIRREGLDLDLVRYVELRSQGVQPLPEPYRTPASPEQSTPPGMPPSTAPGVPPSVPPAPGAPWR
ncbi:hypothetical protein [Frondihabitans cladoniiphilus]|uniref:DUF7847 domain-containing protein n=1 Tax=Frondihabitans cladoniiphilus TaxID=715785 RepID=A0ABP8WEL4_9MICO